MRTPLVSSSCASRLDLLVDKLSCLSRILQLIGVRDNRERNAPLRTIFVNHKRPTSYSGSDEPLNYANNEMITSKYTWWNLAPKNLAKQLSQVANLYFLANSLICFYLPNPPVNPISNAIPVVFVILLAMFKEVFEDIWRHKADWETNSKLVKVFSGTTFTTIKWKNIRCGDIVCVERDTEFPCDLLLLHSSLPSATCHIQTSNLDGETTLKVRCVPHRFVAYRRHRSLLLDMFSGVITCEKPNNRLYEFKGNMFIDNQTSFPISNENLLLRGSTLKTAAHIYGCAIYTGRDTKMMQNFNASRPIKRSCVSSELNKYMALLVVMLLVMTLMCLFGSMWYEAIIATHWYVPVSTIADIVVDRLTTFMFYANIIYLIPISLYITMGLVKFVGSMFFEWDVEMFDEETQQAAKVNTADLCEDLGQVEYLFTDKTGTLTENRMVFKHFAIDGQVFTDLTRSQYEAITAHSSLIADNNNTNSTNTKLRKLVDVLSLCHTLQVDDTASNSPSRSPYANADETKYNASSADELSFMQFCVKIGVHFKGDRVDALSNRLIRRISYSDNVEKDYELLHVLEFDSNRKRMSVLVRDCDTDEHVLYCKGADTAIFANTSKSSNKTISNNCHDDDNNKDETKGEAGAQNSEQVKYAECLRSFAACGWRTLALAYKTVSSADYAVYDKWISEANSDILRREERLAHVYELIEKDLSLVGVTAVEDKLQQDVDVTIDALAKAGIKIWVLTGDKTETAVSICESCRHFDINMSRLFLTDMSDRMSIETTITSIEHMLRRKERDKLRHALTIDGSTLTRVCELGMERQFADVAMRCDSVLCCRMSPSQKALIVRLVKESKQKPVTAAIGDGANDVAMIQEAHVGLGIYGKEGRDAARASDFTFAQFRHLRRALLVHGYLYYTRYAILAMYFFYKNMVFSLCKFLFAFSSAFSTTVLFCLPYLIFYDMMLTIAPVFIYALFEQRASIGKLFNNPFYYRTIRKNRLFRFRQFVKWLLISIWHACIAFFIPVMLSEVNSLLTMDFYKLSALILLLLFVIVHGKLALIWHHKSMLTLFSLIFSVGGFAFICNVYQELANQQSVIATDTNSLLSEYSRLFNSIDTLLVVLLVGVMALVPDLVIQIVEEIRQRKLFQVLARNVVQHDSTC